MGNRPIQYVLHEQTANLGRLKGIKVLRARATGRERINHRNFCEEVARATTFTGAEVEAVLRLASEVAKKHVENGDIVDFGDIGTLTPSFKSKQVIKGEEEFRASVHIVKPKVRLRPSRKYFELRDVSYERVEPKPKKEDASTLRQAQRPQDSENTGSASEKENGAEEHKPKGHTGL